MSLIIATGSNQGDSLHLLREARTQLSEAFDFIAESRIYRSAAVDYEQQPDFFNQVLEFHLPASTTPDAAMLRILELERSMGRRRDIPKGPRTIDIDIIFWGLAQHRSPTVIIPHPRWQERSFVVRPLSELPFFQTIRKCFTIPDTFTVEASPI